jgi:hypothetical protein
MEVDEESAGLKDKLTLAKSDERSEILGSIKNKAQDCFGIFQKLYVELDNKQKKNPSDPLVERTKELIKEMSNDYSQLLSAVLTLPGNLADMGDLPDLSFLTPFVHLKYSSLTRDLKSN